MLIARRRPPSMVSLIVNAVAVVTLTAFLGAIRATTEESRQITIQMPRYSSTDPEPYLCTAVPVPQQPHNVIRAEPFADSDIVHHMLVYGCNRPVLDAPSSVWSCKEDLPVCAGEDVGTTIYGWAQDGPTLTLPSGLGFPVGGGTQHAYLVLQVHYAVERDGSDQTGVKLTLTSAALPHMAGTMIFNEAPFTIPPRQPSYQVHRECCYRGLAPVTMVAAIVHTHGLGTRVTFSRNFTNGTSQLLHEGDPRLPQGFYPAAPHVIFPGERFTSTCQFNTSRLANPVRFGLNNHDEMCLVYLLVQSPLPAQDRMVCTDFLRNVTDILPGTLPAGGSLAQECGGPWSPVNTPSSTRERLGEVASITLAPDGTLWVLRTGGRGSPNNSAVWDQNNTVTVSGPVLEDVVVQLDAEKGTVLQQWGAGQFWIPHRIIVDRDGHIWVTDSGRHQVLKFSSSGDLLMELGERMIPGRDQQHLCRPGRAVTLTDGRLIVADGACNRRALMFSPAGQYLGTYAAPDMGPVGEVVVDECDELVYLAEDSQMVPLLHVFNLSSFERVNTRPITQDKYRLAAMKPGPFSGQIALQWSPGAGATLMDVVHNNRSWKVPGLSLQVPSDFAIGPAPLDLTGAADRLIAIYIAMVGSAGASLQRYVLVPGNKSGVHLQAGPQGAAGAFQGQSCIASTSSRSAPQSTSSKKTPLGSVGTLAGVVVAVLVVMVMMVVMVVVVVPRLRGKAGQPVPRIFWKALPKGPQQDVEKSSS